MARNGTKTAPAPSHGAQSIKLRVLHFSPRFAKGTSSGYPRAMTSRSRPVDDPDARDDAPDDGGRRRRFDWGSRPTSPEVRARPNTPADAVDAGRALGERLASVGGAGLGRGGAWGSSSVVCVAIAAGVALLAAGLAQFAVRGGLDFM